MWQWVSDSPLLHAGLLLHCRLGVFEDMQPITMRAQQQSSLQELQQHDDALQSRESSNAPQ